MPSCDMCGAEGKLVRALVEGTELNVCSGCAKFGKAIPSPVRFVKKQKEVREQKPESLDIIVPEYSRIIRKKREEAGISQDDLAKKIAEKQSVIQKVESGQMEPSINLAKKLENFFKIRLIEKYDEKGGALSTKRKTAEFTIGDAIRVKQKGTK
ncbi:TIGR00270 family protein [Candidatus Woesearchaeota archaeon]|nr:TIGR00270 family protein [Candidatus Woesearchaeota archaeon]